jgi:uncharacterized protein YndB with AHSA1/START domain
MKRHLSWFALALAIAATTAYAQATQVENSSFVAPDGTRTLQQSIVLPATLADTWAAFTTSDGFTTWAAPVAQVDFRLGGIMESSFQIDGKIGAAGNIRNEIVAFVPHRMIAFRNRQAPPDAPFDAPTFQSLHTVAFFDVVGERATRVTLTQPGYRSGELYDGVYKHFEEGNAWSLGALKFRFEKGPLNWKRMAEAQAASKKSK